jgi:hypothetical protein
MSAELGCTVDCGHQAVSATYVTDEVHMHPFRCKDIGKLTVRLIVRDKDHGPRGDGSIPVGEKNTCVYIRCRDPSQIVTANEVEVA